MRNPRAQQYRPKNVVFAFRGMFGGLRRTAAVLNDKQSIGIGRDSVAGPCVRGVAAHHPRQVQCMVTSTYLRTHLYAESVH